jgi:hypothetical protein
MLGDSWVFTALFVEYHTAGAGLVRFYRQGTPVFDNINVGVFDNHLDIRRDP